MLLWRINDPMSRPACDKNANLLLARCQYWEKITFTFRLKMFQIFDFGCNVTGQPNKSHTIIEISMSRCRDDCWNLWGDQSYSDWQTVRLLTTWPCVIFSTEPSTWRIVRATVTQQPTELISTSGNFIYWFCRRVTHHQCASSSLASSKSTLWH